jgi:type VI protein secretion system component VasF
MKKKTNEQLIVELQQQMWSSMIGQHDKISVYELHRVRDDIKASIAVWSVFLTFVLVFMLAVTYG